MSKTDLCSHFVLVFLRLLCNYDNNTDNNSDLIYSLWALSFASVTFGRGQLATQEESSAVMDLVYQLEARNPTPDATNVNAIGEWGRVVSAVLGW